MVLGRMKTPEIPKIFEKIFHFLLHMKQSNKNYQLATEAFQYFFLKNPQFFQDFIIFYKVYLISNYSPNRTKIAQAHLNIFSQICEFFGYYEIKIELDDLSFFITSPVEYKKIKKEL
jgi:hypothetical protein